VRSLGDTRGTNGDMAAEPASGVASRVLDKRLLQRAVAALQARLGFGHDPNATGEQAQEISLREGVRPEDCIGSREVLRMRDERREKIDS
jgi:hypothetical protein